MNTYIKRTENLNSSQRKRNSKKRLSRILVLMITFVLISVLIISAPARAFVLSLTMDKTNVTVGGKVVFIASININSDENLPIQKLVLELVNNKNGDSSSCTFNVDGSVISGCNGISIVKLNGGNSFYGYSYGYFAGYAYDFGNGGYGYGYKDSLLYEITLNTQGYSAGDYSTRLTAFIDNNVFSKDGEKLTIKPIITPPTPTPTRHGGSLQVLDDSDVICLNAWKCTEWSKCEDGYQTRTCGQTRSDCLLTQKPAEERECALQLGASASSGFSGFANFGNNYGNDETSETKDIVQENLPEVKMSLIVAAGGVQMLIILLLMAGIVGLLLAIDIVLLIDNARRVRRARRLRKIMYRPNQTQKL